MPKNIPTDTKNRTVRRSIAFIAISYVVMTLFGTVANACEGDDTTPHTVAIGSKVQELRFKDIRSVPRSLDDLGTHRAYVFAFVTTQCPIVKKTIPKLKELYPRQTP